VNSPTQERPVISISTPSHSKAFHGHPPPEFIASGRRRSPKRAYSAA
jgi:hypothetical protein